MSNLQKTIISAVVLLGVTVLVMVHYTDTNLAIAFGLYGTVLGYAFGNTNGEKSLAAALLQAQANAVTPGINVTREAFNTAAEKVAPATVIPNAPVATVDPPDGAASLPISGA